MQKTLASLVFLLSATGIFATSSPLTVAGSAHHGFVTEDGLRVTRDPCYGNLLLRLSPEITLDVAKTALTKFVSTYAEGERGHAFSLKLPVAQAALVPGIIGAGFSFYHGDNAFLTYILKNDSLIPSPFTAIAGARIAFMNDGKVLLVRDKAYPYEFTLPGGAVDTGKMLTEAAVERACRETGITAGNLKPLALLNRRKANRYEASDYIHYYLCGIFSRELEHPPADDILSEGWFTLEEIASGSLEQDSVVFGVDLVVKEIIQHLQRKEGTCMTSLLDYRQQGKSEGTGDSTDVMSLEMYGLA